MFDLSPLEQEMEKLLATEQLADVVELRVLANQMEFAWLRAIEEYARSDEWVEEGFAVAASALRVKCGITQGAANASLKLARKLRELPVVSEAFAAGELSRQHAAVIADARTPERAAAISELEAAIVDAAKLATPRELGQIVERITDALDGDDGAATANDKYGRRRLHMSEMLDGMIKVDGFLDPELGRRLRKQVNDMARSLENGQDSDRTPAQLRADALAELCEIGTAHADVGAGRETVTDVAIHVDLADIEAGGGPELAAEVRANAPNIPKVTLQRLACDCRISRVITDGPSRVLDIGRASRNPTAAQFRALVARDTGCSWPGCDRPPGWCQSHHIRHWGAGGPTDLDNLRLLCGYHHRMVHEGGKDPP